MRRPRVNRAERRRRAHRLERWAVWAAVLGAYGAGAAADARAAADLARGDLPSRAFMLLGTEHSTRILPEGGSKVASDVSRTVADVAELPDGRIVVLGADGRLDVIDSRGRIARLPVRFRTEAYEPADLDVTSTGALLVASGEQLWRVDPGGAARALTPPVPADSDSGVLAVDALSDGGYLYAERARIWRVAADGTRVLVAGTGVVDDAQPGPATASPLSNPTRIAQLDDGRIVFIDDSGSAFVWVVADGALRLRSVPGYAPRDLLSMPGGRLGVLTWNGLWVLEQGERKRIVHTQNDADPPFPRVWAGSATRRVAVRQPTAVARMASGDWLVGSGDGLALLTAPVGHRRRLAVAVHTGTRAAIRRGRVHVTSTRRATVKVTASARGRRVTVGGGRIPAGFSTLRLSQRLPGGRVDLELRARADDGAVASHGLRVISGRTLSLPAARAAALDDAWTFGGDIQPYVERCRRLRRDAFVCSVSGVGERWMRGRVELRADGWIWISWGGRFHRADIA